MKIINWSFLISIVFVLFFPSLISAKTIKKFDTEFLIHVKTYHPKDDKIAKEIKEKFSDNMDKFQRRMKQFPDIHIFIRIAPTNKYFEDWTKKRNKIAEFSDGFTDMRTKEIFLKNPAKYQSIERLHQVIMHEYIHLFINHYFYDAPLWFHEGMAVYLSEGISYERYYNFMKFYAFKQQNLIKATPYNYPDNLNLLEPYYFQSAQAVKTLITDQPKNFEEFWDKGNGKNKFDDAFLLTFQTLPSSFLNNFDNSIHKLFYNGIVFIILTSIWSFLPIILILAVIRKHRKNKKILEEWENQEYEEPEKEYIPENLTENEKEV